MSCTGNNYRMLLNSKNELTNKGLSVWNERYCKLNDSINVINEMIDVKNELKNFKVLIVSRWKDSLTICALIYCS